MDTHLIYTDTTLLKTVCFVPGERKPLHFLGHPVNTDSAGAIESVRISGVSVLSWLNLEKM